jgi:hypothetical protein
VYFETWKKKLGNMTSKRNIWGGVFWDLERKLENYDIKEKCFGDLYFETWKEKKRNLLETCILRPGRKKERRSLEVWH